LAERPGLVDRAIPVLEELERVFQAADGAFPLPSGPFNVSRDQLFRKLSRMIEGGGYRADLSKRGPLATILAMVFEGVGEDANVHDVIANRMRKVKRLRK